MEKVKLSGVGGNKHVPGPDRGSESPNGKEIWDGAGWRLLSDDKAWWWDSTAWQAIGDLKNQALTATTASLSTTDDSYGEGTPDVSQDGLDVDGKGQLGPGGTGQVRELPNGAIVSGDAYYYWAGVGWRPLVPAP